MWSSEHTHAGVPTPGRVSAKETVRPSDAHAADPDLLTDAEPAPELEGVVTGHGYVWRRFAEVPHVLGGRLAALAQGLAVRPARIDMLVPEAAVPLVRLLDDDADIAELARLRRAG